MPDQTENQPDTVEARMRELRGRLERLRDAPGAHREGAESMLAELAYYEGLPRTETAEARAEWADREHIRGQLAEIWAALRWEENRLS